MPIVIGVDFGTLSVRVSIVDSEKGRLASADAEYPLIRSQDDPEHASQAHAAHMNALVQATRAAVRQAGIPGSAVLAMALDTTGSTVIPVDQDLQPLDDYYMWCDHRAKDEAALITRLAQERHIQAIDWCGGVCSSEAGIAKLLHWLRHNPEKRARFATALEHCDMVAAVLCGISDPMAVPRSISAASHRWIWNAALGGLPPEEFLADVDPLFAGVRKKLAGTYATSDAIAGRLSPEWAAKLGLTAGIPIPVGGIDCHWDAIGAGIREGDIVNVVGTSTCFLAIAREAKPIPGVCGVVPGSVHPKYVGIEAGLSASGAVFEAIARRAGSTVPELSRGLERYAAGQTGLLRLTWDNGDRTVLANAELRGVTLGWSLVHTAQDELFATIEGSAFHSRVVFERMADYGVPINRIINGGGVPQKNEALNQVYANVLNKPVLVPLTEPTSLGSAIFAFLAAGVFETVEEAQKALCPPYRTVCPQPQAVRVYEQLYPLYRSLYFSLGAPASSPVSIGQVLPALLRIAEQARATCAAL